MSKKAKLRAARAILVDLGLPRAQQNERTALCLLALLNLRPGRDWSDAEAPMIGITPIMDWARQHYKRDYAPNTRETFRRQSMHQFLQAGLSIYNPDKPDRPVNSPNAVYQISPELLKLLKIYGTRKYKAELVNYLKLRPTLAAVYAKSRKMRIPLKANAFPKGSRTAFRDDSGHRSERSDAGFSIVQEVFGFVKIPDIRSAA